MLRNQRNNQPRGNERENDKLAVIAEILGLLEEKSKSKEWIFQEIKKHSLKLSVKQTMNSFEILKACPDGFISQLLRVLKSDGFEDFEEIRTLTKTYHWFYTDIVASSDPSIPTTEQARKIIVLNELIARTETFKQRNPDSTIIFPTGDGMNIGFSDTPEKPLRLAVELHKLISRYSESRKRKDKLQIRIGIDTGPVYIIKDLNGKDNVWGPGIIMARRVMELGGPMQVFASARIAHDLSRLSPQYRAIMHPIGDYAIKHGEQLLIYNIYGDGFGSKGAPRKGKIQKSKTTEESQKNVNTFLFGNVEVKLDVTDPKTMMTHHTWLWNVINITKEPKDSVFYYLDGDAPKDFPDMNVTIKDEDNKELDIISLNVNKPYHKEFIVKFNKPLKPNQKGKLLKLEYDWEEPDRNFFYKFASNCMRFKYLFTIPKGVEIKNRVLKVDPETGYKVHATPAASVKYLNDRTEISWQASNLHAYDGYRFEW
ncbi:MAG: hypothetical protein ACRD9Q_02435 [Nitrososphaeraceae archaeon]